MENSQNVFIDNDGDAIDLNSIECIYRLRKKKEKIVLSMRYKSGEDLSLEFLYSDYSACDEDVLFNKINKIRTDIIKKWNGDKEPFIIFNKIDLTKKTEENK
jgi:hypothetical protein